MHSNEDNKESVERAERLQGEHRARALQLDRNWAPSVLLALLAKAPGPTLSPLPDPPRENTRRKLVGSSVGKFSRGVYWLTEVVVLQYYLQPLYRWFA